MAVPVEAKNDLQFMVGKKMGTLALLWQGNEFLASAQCPWHARHLQANNLKEQKMEIVLGSTRTSRKEHSLANSLSLVW